MGKFQVLAFNQKIMEVIGIHSYRLNEPTNEFFKSFVAYYIMCNVSTIVVGSLVFAFIHFPNIEMISEAGVVFCGSLQTLGVFAGFGANMPILKELHLKLQEIVDEDHEIEIFNIYWNIEQKVELWTRRAVSYTYFNQQMYVAAIFYSIYCMFTGNLDTSTWILQFTQLWVPFGTETIRGWYLMCWIQFGMGLSYALINTTITVYFVSCTFYIGAMCDHFDFLIESATSDVKNCTEERGTTRYSKMAKEMHQKLSRAVDIHDKVHDIFGTVSDLFSKTLFALLPANIMHLAFMLYNTEHSDLDIVTFLWHLISAICGLIWPFLYCYYATEAIERVDEIRFAAYDAAWYDYPPEYRKYVILMILRSQEEMNFSGMGMVYCSLATFKILWDSAVSYRLNY